MTENYNAFKGLDLSNARNENETREQYKTRLKVNKQILKLYNTVGREKFQQMFPNGVEEALKASTEKLGEAK
jgi:hypothetical protein